MQTTIEKQQAAIMAVVTSACVDKELAKDNNVAIEIGLSSTVSQLRSSESESKNQHKSIGDGIDETDNHKENKNDAPVAPVAVAPLSNINVPL